MLSSDAIAEPGKDVVSEKVQEYQMKGSGESPEAEATSSSGMKSPVTPAAICESNGTPALRWKSYTKQKESGSHGKLSSAPGVDAIVADSKGKLVINLCGIPRSLIKVPSPPLEPKSSTPQDTHSRKSDAASNSSQEPASNGNVDDDDDRSFGAPIDATGGHENLHAGSSDESVPSNERGVELIAPKCQSKASHFARKVCRRIRMVRRTLNVAKKPNGIRCGLKALSKEETFLHSRRLNDPDDKGGLQSVSDVDNSKERRICEDKHINGMVDQHDEATGSEDLIYSDDNKFSPRNTSSDHGACRYRGMATSGLSKEQPVEYKKEMSAKDISSVTAVGKMSADATLASGLHHEMLTAECTPRDIAAKNEVCGRHRVKSLSHDVGAFSETSKLDEVKEQTVLETLLRDEAPGYSSGGGSEQSRGFKVEKSGGIEYARRSGRVVKSEQSEDSGSSKEESYEEDDEGTESDGYDEEESVSNESHECEDGEWDCEGLPPVSHRAPGKGVALTEQVPSVLCDAEGNVWHIGKRAEQARGKASPKRHLITDEGKKVASFTRTSRAFVAQELVSKRLSGPSVAPHSQEIELKWRSSSDVDYTISSEGDVSNRSMILKEKAIFVGCIPDGTENLEDVLQSSMQKFLERFDFAPASVGQIRLVKVVRDFAFLELATEKVANIVLTANQLDVFEWGVNSFHFNIEGCKGTHTSVRPSIEYMPLKPTRVIFVGNVPKSRWQKEYLKVFFARILKGADGPVECEFVSSIFLLPESCDAYVELTSEIMADAIVFKCLKNPLILKEIGEDVFICRDPSSVPLMSKHKGVVCPQRSLFIGVSAPGQEFKIDAVRRNFEDLLSMITRETNQSGYLEFISIQPGKNYAFFQFSSESIVDAVMEEYIKNTHLFVCGSNPISYIILRPPGYERPGARYRCEGNRIGRSRSGVSHTKKQLNNVEVLAGLVKTKKSNSRCPSRFSRFPTVPRRFGDEPAKKADCVMSIGVSPLPKATWNGLPFTGARATDPECLLLIEGLPKGFTYKLLRGALNELFEKSLSHTGLLEVEMLVLRHLDRDPSLGVVASLPNSKFVNALLLLRKPLAIAGSELRLIPAYGGRKVTWKGSIAEHGKGQGEVSCLSDDRDVYEDKLSKRHYKNVKNAPGLTGRKRKGLYGNHSQGRMNLATKRNACNLVQDVWCEESLKTISPPVKRLCRGDKGVERAFGGIWKVPSRGLPGKCLSKPTTVRQWNGSFSKGSMPHAFNVKGRLKYGNRDTEHLFEARSNSEEFLEESLHIVSEGGKRKIQKVGAAPKTERGLGRASVVNAVNRKRKLILPGQDSSAFRAAFIQKNFKKLCGVCNM